MIRIALCMLFAMALAVPAMAQDCPSGACPQSIVLRSYETVAVDTVYKPVAETRHVVAHKQVASTPVRRRVSFTTRTTMVPVKTSYKTVTRTRRIWR